MAKERFCGWLLRALPISLSSLLISSLRRANSASWSLPIAGAALGEMVEILPGSSHAGQLFLQRMEVVFHVAELEPGFVQLGRRGTCCVCFSCCTFRVTDCLLVLIATRCWAILARASRACWVRA